MSARKIFDTAPLGSLIHYSDGTPQPPARFNKKLADWKTRNGTGTLVAKQPQRAHATYMSPASITLRADDIRSGAVVLVIVNRIFSLDSRLSFEIVEAPKPGMVRVINQLGDSEELLHIADNRDVAAAWLAQSGYPNARLDDVTADKITAAAA